MAEILFYHLTERTLEQTLPGLLERSLERGWKVVVQVGSDERLQALDSHLWSWRDESFLPHGSVRDGNETMQPVWLTTGTDNPNQATVRFLVDGSQLSEANGYERVVYLFDGHDNDAVEQARLCWKRHKEEAHDLTYWQQTDTGGWEKKA